MCLKQTNSMNYTYPAKDLGFSEKGAKPSSESLKQGVWGRSPPKAIGCLAFKYPSLSFRAYVTSQPAKGTKWAQNTPYHKMVHNYFEFYVQYLLSVNCKMLPINFFIDGKMFTYIA